MKKRVLETERLLLKPLSYRELSYININDIDRIEYLIEHEAIFDFVKLAISKKLEMLYEIIG